MSKSDKNEFKEIAKKITTASAEDIDGLYEQLNSLTKIDFKSELSKIRENSFEKINSMELNDISKRDLVTAIQKQGILTKDAIPELKTRSESGMSCKQNCAVQYAASAALCFFVPPPADIGCAAIATILYVACVDAC